MALLEAQIRELSRPTGHHWGDYPSVSELPNVSGATAQEKLLQFGAIASVNGQLYVCNSRALGAAVWGLIPDAGAATFGAPLKVYNVAPQGAIASRGTDGVSVDGTTYYSELYLPANKTLTGFAPLKGTTVGTDKVQVGLYDSSGNLLANSAVAGVALATADKYQEVAFLTAYDASPGTYFVAFQLNGTTDGMQRIATDGVEVVTGSFTGTFGTWVDPIASVATTFTTALGPIGYVY